MKTDYKDLIQENWTENLGRIPEKYFKTRYVLLSTMKVN
jgi:hypothetical protein